MGAEAHPFPALVGAGTFRVLGVTVTAQPLVVLGVGVAAVIALQAFLIRTRTGRCMQASAQNPAVARRLGIPVRRMILYTFIINAVLVAVAAVLVTPVYLDKFSNAETLGLAAFIPALVGGFNHVRGAIAGGLLLGVLDNLATAYVSATYRGAVLMLLLIGMILLRPHGLLGRPEQRTA